MNIFCKKLLLTIACFAAPLAAYADNKRPDLSGTYDTATITPLQRPPEFGDNLYLTKEQAMKLEQAQAERMAESDSDPNREAPPSGGDGSEGAAGNVGGYNAFWIDDGDSVNMVNGKLRTSIMSTPGNGRFPKRTAEGQKRQFKFFSAFERKNEGQAYWVLEGDGKGPYDNMEQRPAAERCLMGFGSTAGPPMMPVLYNNLKRIVQTETHVMILIEMVHDARIIRLDSEHLPQDVKRWMGDSIGWWEDDTLVVETTNFLPSAGYLSFSENLKVEERFRRLDDNTLLYSFMVEDPDTWEEPWGGEYTWPATEDKVYEYACHESNYALGNIMRGARLLEQEAMAAGGGK